MKNKIYVLMKFPSQPDKRNLSSLFRICILLLLTGLWGTNSWAQVTLTATSGSPAGSFTTLKGAFDRFRITQTKPYKQQDLFSSAPRTGPRNFTKVDDDFEDEASFNDTDEDIKQSHREIKSPGNLNLILFE